MKKIYGGLVFLGTIVTAFAAQVAPLTVIPTNVGAYSAWTTSTGTVHYTLVDEPTCNNNVDYVSTNTVGARDSYAVSLASIPNGSMITGMYLIPCVSQNVATSSSANAAVFYRLNGVNSANSASLAVNGNTFVTKYLYYLVPTTVKTSSTTLEIGAVLTGGAGGVRLSKISALVMYSLPVLVPPAPSALTATQVSSSTFNFVSLNWKDNSSNESGFTVERSTNGTTFSVVKTVSANAINFIDAPAPGTYYYRVRAYNADGYSAYSNTTTVTVTAPIVPPAAPTNLVAEATSSIVFVHWTDNSSNENGFVIERSASGTIFSNLSTVGANVTSYFDNPATGTYYYRVKAYNGDGGSAYSNTVFVTVPVLPPEPLPAVPTNLVIVATTSPKFVPSLSWKDNSDNEDSFTVRRTFYFGPSFVNLPEIIATLPANTTSYIDNSADSLIPPLMSSVSFVYTISAVNKYGFIAGPSTTFTIDRPIKTPSTLKPSQVGLLVNDNDPTSVDIAQYYTLKRGIPEANIVHLRLPLKIQLTAAEFAPFKAQVDAALPSNVQVMAIAWTNPSRVECNSITSAFARGFMVGSCDPYVMSASSSPYYHSNSVKPFTDFGMRPAMMLAGKTVSDVKSMIDRGVASDNTHPKGKANIMNTSDSTRSLRARQYPANKLGYALSPDVNVEITNANYISGATNTLFYFQGLASVPNISTNIFPAGAIADHLTSYGGMLTDSYQMSCLEFIAGGVTGTFGTVSEPYADSTKFPDPQIMIPHYTRGETLIEAYWKSILQTYQGIFVGEPLANPWMLVTATSTP